MQTSKLNVELLLTGNELMSGDVIDSNSAFIAQELGSLGLEVTRRVTVKDDLSMLAEEIACHAKRCDILIINGGLGPTVDDMTAQALAMAAGVDISEHPDAMAHLVDWCQRRNYTLSDSNKKQAMLPTGCDIIPNEAGSAVGFTMRVGSCQIYTTPGVPRELKKMLGSEILPHIQQCFSINDTTDVSRFQVFGLGESTIQDMVNAQLPDWPKHIELGYRAAMPMLEIKLTSHHQQGHDDKLIWQQKLMDILGAHVIGEGRISMARSLINVLEEQDKTVTFAESCTGGLMASLITKEAGSSAAFEAGFVTYSNAMKTKLVNVPEQTLIDHGAVSEQVVIAMLKGALEVSGADVGAAVSGIAGPGGGSDEKPVGLVWIAWGDKDNINTAALYLPLGRLYFQQYVATCGLDLVKRHLLDIAEPAKYLDARKATI
ncbi:CinA family nicotinamide mononucleotide deamidase-related protein [Psychrobium sp. MM17-31]|uniref:CinA family nicotinamide mononucleotide deamidase-related protein n=1 Tax=Psychrobium sp. MM17-31 TaxID=2917758 RepID=UPI001EF3F6FE|nr:CinA family nicotinamide mononucleotide deamidase-related protein [Psychrobium sp. MM17-31]MCG7530699.1 CinA family nicotinamide mononucleotide deamidase-related protein [Psychrobium sp. MM17-31]